VARRKPVAPKLRIPEKVVGLIRNTHPELKRKIRTALENIQEKPHSGKQLKDELIGLRSYRVSRFRIIYRIYSSKVIDIITIGPRRIIYEETYRLIKKDEKKNVP
jgi:mRNA interferase RelE/StbE